MDVYSCGVVLFIMLVGRKPWDDEDSATLAYAVAHAADAPGFRDRRFRGLSREAQVGAAVWDEGALCPVILRTPPVRRASAAGASEGSAAGKFEARDPLLLGHTQRRRA